MTVNYSEETIRALDRQGEVHCKLYLLDGKMLRVDFGRNINSLILTPAEAIELGRQLIESAAVLNP